MRWSCALTLDVPDWPYGGLKGGIASPISPEGSSTDGMPETIETCISWDLPHPELGGSRPGFLIWARRGRQAETYSWLFAFLPRGCLRMFNILDGYSKHRQQRGSGTMRGGELVWSRPRHPPGSLPRPRGSVRGERGRPITELRIASHSGTQEARARYIENDRPGGTGPFRIRPGAVSCPRVVRTRRGRTGWTTLFGNWCWYQTSSIPTCPVRPRQRYRQGLPTEPQSYDVCMASTTGGHLRPSIEIESSAQHPPSGAPAGENHSQDA